MSDERTTSRSVYLRDLVRCGVYTVGNPDPTRTLCARCSTPLEVTDATADAVVREHEARCPGPPAVVGRVAEYTWGRSSFMMRHDLGCQLNVGDIVRVKPSPGDSFRAGELEVIGTLGDAVHFTTDLARLIPTIAEMDYVYRVRSVTPKAIIEPIRPSLTEHLARAVADGKAGPSMVGELPARPVRPDGFDQGRIDMLKAAMLASVVKVKR